jgi:hypothetical protein
MNIAIARRSRCKEAADLLGLRRISKDDTFAIAGIVLADLHRIRSTLTFLERLTLRLCTDVYAPRNIACKSSVNPPYRLSFT